MKGFGPLFRMITDKAKALLANRGYDVDAIRAEIAFHGVQAVIPAKRGRRNPALHDRDKYRQRNVSSNSSTSSRNGDASPHVTTKPENPTSASSASLQHCCGSLLSTKPRNVGVAEALSIPDTNDFHPVVAPLQFYQRARFYPGQYVGERESRAAAVFALAAVWFVFSRESLGPSLSR
ncbi:hypothetical protein [Sphingomonas sp. QA11]|uniref:hypothetical protein n=1 Tax=Sphingomonas sp. QA11 TaxID=2950605 RepID=UPI003FA7EFE9